jgi:outer membrane lipoprotein carrier protein
MNQRVKPVILSEESEANESKDLQLPFGALHSETTSAVRVGSPNAPTSDSAEDPRSPIVAHALKGHDFSRAVSDPKRTRALAPEAKFAYIAGKAFVLALLSIFCSHLQAQPPAPTAHDLAQRVDHHYNLLHSLKAQFAETYEGLGRVRSESGTLLLLKPGRMRWDYSNPSGKVFLLDGKYAWFYSKGDPQVQRVGAKQLDDLRSPLRFLLGHTQLEKEIDHLAVSAAANGSFILAGVPRGQEKRVQRLALTVTADGIITAIEIQETDGAETRFSFDGEQTNAPIPSSTFKFTPPAGVPVVDAMPPV